MLYFNHLQQRNELSNFTRQSNQKRARDSLRRYFPQFSQTCDIATCLKMHRCCNYCKPWCICKPKLRHLLLRVSYRSFFNNKHLKGWMGKCIYRKSSKRRLLHQKGENMLAAKDNKQYFCLPSLAHPSIPPTLKCKTEHGATVKCFLSTILNYSEETWELHLIVAVIVNLHHHHDYHPLCLQWPPTPLPAPRPPSTMTR